MSYKYCYTLIFSLITFVAVNSQKIAICEKPNIGFWSESPAKIWQESLLSGNGTLGVMVMGYPNTDTIITNHALLYMPINKPLLPINQGDHLSEIRELMLNGEYGKASQLPVDISHKEGYNEKRWTDPYIPAFDLIMQESNEKTVQSYIRTVNFETGEIEIKWENEEGKFSRQIFVSRPDSVIVIRYRSDKPNGLNTSFRLAERISEPDWWGPGNKGIKDIEIRCDRDYLMGSAIFLNNWDNLIQGYSQVAKIVNIGGCKKETSEGIEIKDANEILILMKVQPLWDRNATSIDLLKKDLDKINFNYSEIQEKHIRMHREMFNRSSLNLGGAPEDRILSSEKLLEKSKKTLNKALIELLYSAARYHTISAIGSNPPNLQGLWGGTMVPAWSADFTTNGNLPVAISSLLPANLPELMLPVFELLEKHLPEFRINAQRLFNCRGIHVPSRLSSHGYNNHFDAVWPMTFWTMGAAWYSMFYYDYYLYSQDQDFLRNRALPFMEESILFYEDFLIENENRYILNPSYSPENNPANIEYQACINATMEIMAVKQLLRNIITTSQLFNCNSDKIEKWKEMLSKMPEYEVNELGQLREWIWPNIEENHDHRHVSHLYGLFDIIDPEISADPILLEGAKKVIRERMKIRRRDNGGVMAFGMVHMAYAAANLGESEQLYDMLKWLSTAYWTRNMFTTHDPGSLFNFDLTGGYPAILIKMLTYSEPGLLRLFPAKPKDFSFGSITGVLLRGGLLLEKLEWNETNIQFSILPYCDQELKIEIPGKIKQIMINDNELIKIDNLGYFKIKLLKNNRVSVKVLL